MPIIVIPESNSHWYRRDGSSIHTTIGKNGLPRPTNLKDAREHGYLPSVTSILKVKSKPQLEAWKQEQAIMAALTLPRSHDEPEDMFAKRVVQDMDRQGKEAAEFGTRIHNYIERTHLNIPHQGEFDLLEYCRSYSTWFGENITEVIHAEKVLVNDRENYAGTVDLVAIHKEWGRIVLDVKTQKVKDKPNFYFEWALQLAAYGNCIEEPVKLVSCIIDSGKPAEPVFKVWEDYDGALKAFQCCHYLWRYERNMLTDS